MKISTPTLAEMGLQKNNDSKQKKKNTKETYLIVKLGGGCDALPSDPALVSKHMSHFVMVDII